jgi:hypothetical protein
MTPVAAPAASPAADRSAADRPVLAGPPLGRDEIAPMPAEMSFGDFLSGLNPLHHIPVVGWVYRQITGETIQPAMRALGGLLMGGPIGAIASAVGALAEELIGATDYTAPTAIAGGAPAIPPAAAAQPGRLATITPPEGQALGQTPGQALPLAARLAARAYPAPVMPLRDAPPPADPAAAFVPAAFVPAAFVPATPVAPGVPPPAPAEPPAGSPAAVPDAAPAAPSASPSPARVRRAPIIPVTSGGQDPAFVQRMMQGLEAYDRAMRGRATPNLPTAAPAAP